MVQPLGNKRQLIHRVAGIEGHVGSLKKMMMDDRDSLEVLEQIAAIRGAIERLSHVIFEEYVEGVLQDLQSSTSERPAAVAEIRAAIETLR
jgi:DNA-binding FrmR family transcriptional regulator